MSWTLIESQTRPRESAVSQNYFDLHHVIDGDTGCWIWTGSMNSNGYGLAHGRLGVNRPVGVPAHRVSMYLVHGSIPDNMVVDHKCHVDAIEAGTCAGGDSCKHRRCVNPDHLRFLTAEENRRYRTYPKHEKKKCVDTCVSGRHPWTEENIIIRDDGGRYCYPCFRETANAAQQKRRAEQNPGKRSKQYWENTHCPKGHERTPENTANDAGRLRCRVCKNEMSRVWQAKKRSV